MYHLGSSSHSDVKGFVSYNNATSTDTSERVLADIQRAYPSVSYIDHVLIVTWDPGSCNNFLNDKV